MAEESQATEQQQADAEAQAKAKAARARSKRRVGRVEDGVAEMGEVISGIGGEKRDAILAKTRELLLRR